MCKWKNTFVWWNTGINITIYQQTPLPTVIIVPAKVMQFKSSSSIPHCTYNFSPPGLLHPESTHSLTSRLAIQGCQCILFCDKSNAGRRLTVMKFIFALWGHQMHSSRVITAYVLGWRNCGGREGHLCTHTFLC